MQSTIVTLSGKGTNPKTTLYVGGLDESVDVATLHAAFIPFGDLTDVSVPLDHATGKHRGFGFVQYEASQDAEDAVDNMNNAELYGRVLRVNFAQPSKIKGGDKGWASQPVWADTDAWIEKQLADEQLEELEDGERKKAAQAELAAQQPDAMQQMEADTLGDGM